MVDPGHGQIAHHLVRQLHARGDQIGVEPRPPRRLDEGRDIAPGQGLAAGEMDVQDAERRRLPYHPQPRGGIELGAGPLKLKRVGTIGAA